MVKSKPKLLAMPCRGHLDTRISQEDMVGAKPNMCAFHSRILARSRCPRVIPTRTCCSCLTYFQLATWPRKIAISSQGKLLLFGAAGLFAIMSAFVLGAKRVIAMDAVAERLALAKKLGAETIDYADRNVHDQIIEMTKGAGPDAVIDAVGMESHGAEGVMQKVASAVQSKVSATDRPYALNDAIMCCRPGGTVSVPGVYLGAHVPVAMGSFMNKGLTMRSGQTHVHKYLNKLMGLIEEGTIDPALIITHTTADLADGPDLYKTFRDKADGCIKCVLFPNGETHNSKKKDASKRKLATAH